MSEAALQRAGNAAKEHRVQIPAWARPLEQPGFYKSIRGGRGSTKTWTVARLFILRAIAEPRIRIFCCREIQASINDSNFQVVKDQINLMGLGEFFDVQAQQIICNNGSEFQFWGLEKRRESIRGWENVSYCWIEQAERMTDETWKVIVPTMSRNEGAEIWLTWNPVFRTDAVWQRFVEKPRQRDISLSVNYTDLPAGFFAPSFYQECDELREEDPDLYAHIYLGVPDDGSADTKILTYSMLKSCVDAYHMAPPREEVGVVDVGFDISDGGVDSNAVVARRGPCVEAVEHWKSKTPGYLAPTAARAHDVAMSLDAWRMYFDVTGVGSPMRGELARLDPQYRVIPVLFGGKPGGPEAMYDRGVTNEAMFSKRNIQMGWALRSRARNTLRRIRGNTEVPLEDCLFINPEIPKLEHFMGQLAQPVFRRMPSSGKLEMDKRDGNETSPDLYDATAMAFCRDSERGLRAARG